MKLKFTVLFSLIFAAALYGIFKSHQYQDCFVRRAAFDVGSGSIKVKVSDIDRCKRKILKTVFTHRKSVQFKADLSTRDSFSQPIQDKGIQALQELMQQVRNLSPTPQQFSGVATAAFRQAKNGKEFANRLSEVLKFPITVISQKEEAMIGFHGASTASPFSLDELIVWDIGGGSMQIITQSSGPKKDYNFYNGKLASIALKNFIIRDLKNLKLEETRSPNPIGEKVATEAVKVSNNHAFQFVSTEIKEKILKHPTKILGIGGVHYYSVKDQLNLKKGEPYTIDKLINVIRTKQHYNDQKVGGPFAETDVSNLILVYGYMKALGIKEVLPAKINLTDGLLMTAHYWEM